MTPEEKLHLLHKADKVLIRCASELGNYSYINPLNKDEEFEKFIANNKNYSPQFTYKSFDAKPFVEELESLEIPEDHVLSDLFEKSRQDLLKMAKAFLFVGTDSFSSDGLFEPLTDETIKEAQRILDSHAQIATKPAEKTVSSEELAQRIKIELNSYGLRGWRIVFDTSNASVVSIRGGEKLIKVRPDELITKRRLNKLLVHEIGTHVLRAANGENQDFLSFMEGLPGYLLTEEGLASYNELTQGFRSKQTELTHALRVTTVNIAKSGGFLDVYNFVRPYLKSDKRAFYFSVRAKRGLVDSSKPGGFLKDHLYLQGLLKIKNYVNDGGSIADLYAGKIRVEDVHLVKEGAIKPATILPKFLK